MPDCRAKRHAGHFYAGLLLASPFAPAHKPVMLAGYCQHGEISVRSQDDYDPAIPSVVRYYPPVTFAELQVAAKIASQIAAIETASLGRRSLAALSRPALIPGNSHDP